MSVRVRMAPSPTGFLHVGGVRTFLFNWLFARQQGGECRLRIENTDTSREVAEAVDQIQESLRWLGIDWDGPTTFQLDRMDEVRTYADRLLAEGKAYEDEGAIRFRMPDEGVVGWDDVVRGRIEFQNENLADLVIVRADGRPTYNFASPVEDMLDGITHVIRGQDHVSNTPTQINILTALGAELPVYAHVARRARRRRQEAVEAPRRRLDRRVPRRRLHPRGADELPRAARLELRRQDDRDDARRSSIERFSLERVGPSPATFDYEKLDWLNGVHLRELERGRVRRRRLLAWLREQGIDWPDDRVRATVPLVQEKLEKLSQYPDYVRFLFEPVSPDGADPAIAARRPRCSGVVEPWDGGRDRAGAARVRRGGGPEAARGVRADPARGHRLEGLARALREPRAAREGRVARAARGALRGGT